MTKVSIIVPIYNMELYLKECLDSILSQTLKEIEVVCIDDGSTDRSWEILAEYAKAPFVRAVGGSWLCSRSDIAQGRFEHITELCRQAKNILAGL